MVESSSLEEGNILKYTRNLFRLENIKKDTIDTIIKDIGNLFSVRNKPLSLEEYFNQIRLYLKDIIKNLKKSDM